MSWIRPADHEIFADHDLRHEAGSRWRRPGLPTAVAELPSGGVVN